ncbi:ZIP family metal transporter [Pseudolysinimonas kribbensis]|uniref:ZIP family metal transporter n=1 Tax=Pseudolysinimonas kribbensis TaxID=433641 RepID=UPI0031D0EB92
MNYVQIVMLGLIAGVTILLGMPVGRLRNLGPSVRLLLSAISVGVLLFLVWDVLTHAWEPIDAALADVQGASTIALDGAVFVVGLGGGLVGLAVAERRLRAARGADLEPRHLATLIAAGIGVHNFAEGLAIGQSAASGALDLAVVLVVGFALHNATEGFGIVAPLAGESERPTWPFLLVLALIGGGPTVVGAALGAIVVSDLLSIMFLTLAGGSIIYVIVQLVGSMSKARRPELIAAGGFVGLVAGFATDAVLTAAGA